MNPYPSYLANSKTFIDRVQIIFNGLVGTSILLYAAGFFYYSNESKPGAPIIPPGQYLDTISIILLVACPAIAGYLIFNYRKDLKSIPTSLELPRRLLSYQSRSRHIWVNLFILALVPVIFYCLSGWHLFSAVYGVMLVLFTMERPAAFRLYRLLQMNDEEKRKFLEKEDLF